MHSGGSGDAVSGAHSGSTDHGDRPVRVEHRGSVVGAGGSGANGVVRGSGRKDGDTVGERGESGVLHRGAWRMGKRSINGGERFGARRFGVASHFGSGQADWRAVSGEAGVGGSGGACGATCHGAGSGVGRGVDSSANQARRGIHYERNKARRERAKQDKEDAKLARAAEATAEKKGQRDRSALFELRDEREMCRLRREIAMERTTLATGANAARVAEWCQKTREGAVGGRCKTVSSRDGGRSALSLSDMDESVMSANELVLKKELEGVSAQLDAVRGELKAERRKTRAAIQAATADALAVTKRAEEEAMALRDGMALCRALTDRALMDGYEPGSIAYAYDEGDPDSNFDIGSFA